MLIWVLSVREVWKGQKVDRLIWVLYMGEVCNDPAVDRLIWALSLYGRGLGWHGSGPGQRQDGLSARKVSVAIA